MNTEQNKLDSELKLKHRAKQLRPIAAEQAERERNGFLSGELKATRIFKGFKIVRVEPC